MDNNFEKQEGIDKYLFAWVHLLFEIEQNEVMYHLAYLEWYNITDVPGTLETGRRVQLVPRDPETQMAVAVKSGEFNVVSVNAIIRAVHMQPLFTKQDSAQKALENHLNEYSFDSYLVNKYADRNS